MKEPSDEFKLEISDRLNKIMRTRSMYELYNPPDFETSIKMRRLMAPKPFGVRTVGNKPVETHKVVRKTSKRCKLTGPVSVVTKEGSKPRGQEPPVIVYYVRKDPRKKTYHLHQLPQMPELPNATGTREYKKPPKKRATRWCPRKNKTELTMKLIRLFLTMILMICFFVFVARNIPIPPQTLPPVMTTYAPENEVLPVIVYNNHPYANETVYTEVKNKPVNCKLYGANYKGTADGRIFVNPRWTFEDLKIARGNELWGLYQNEGPGNGTLELLSEDVLSLFNVTSTFSRSSDVPFPLQQMPHPSELANAVFCSDFTVKTSLLIDIAPVLYLEDDCDTLTERDEYVKKLMEYIPVDSYGKCVNNKPMPNFSNALNGVFSEAKIETLTNMYFSRYHFFLTFSKAICKDLFPKNFWYALFLGVVPVYYGSSSVRQFMPCNKSAIFLEDYPTPKLLSEHLYELILNKTKYEGYLEHKIHGLSNADALEELRVRPYQQDSLEVIDVLINLVCSRLHLQTRFEPYLYGNKSHYNCSLSTPALSLGTGYDQSTTRVLKAIERGKELYNLPSSKYGKSKVYANSTGNIEVFYINNNTA